MAIFFKRTFIIFINISSYYYLGWGCFFISSVKLKYDNRLFVWLYVFCTRFVLTRFKTQNWALYRLIFIRKKKTLNDTLLCWYFQLVTYIYTDCSTCVLFVIYDIYYFLWEANLFYHTTWSFKSRDTKLERFLHKNQHTQRKSLDFENWTNGVPQ